MNKKWLLILTLVLVIPTTVYAFSWRSFFIPSPKVLTEKVAPLPVLSTTEKKVADQKYLDWDKAYSQNNIKLLVGNKTNFVFSETELNYFVTKSIAKAKKPDVIDVKIALDDGLATVSGYSLMNPFKGPVNLTGKFVSEGKKIKLELTKVQYRGFPLPTSVATSIINRYSPELLSFLYGYPDYSGLEVIIKDDKLELKYNGRYPKS